MTLFKKNQKFELMLMKRARAYSSFCSQVVFVYLQSTRFVAIHFFADKNRKKITGNPFGFLGKHFRV